MSNNIIIIPCAGRSSRMQSETPKPLTLIKDRPFLNYLLESLNHRFDQFIIPIPDDKNLQEVFFKSIESVFINKIKFVPSEPGSGDAQAILDGLESVSLDFEHCFVCWGDTFFLEGFPFDRVFQQAASSKVRRSVYVPLVMEADPYVSYELDKDKVLRVFLSIDGNKFKKGYADQSVFVINKRIKDELKNYKSNLPKKAEINFLKFISSISGGDKVMPIVLNSRFTRSFNTQDELHELMGII